MDECVGKCSLYERMNQRIMDCSRADQQYCDKWLCINKYIGQSQGHACMHAMSQECNINSRDNKTIIMAFTVTIFIISSIYLKVNLLFTVSTCHT